MVDGSNDVALQELKCDTTSSSSSAGSGNNKDGDGCEEYIPSQEKVSEIINRDFESEFVELFLQLKPETRLKIGHYFGRQNTSLEGQPLQGLIRSCTVIGRDCNDIR